MTDIAERPLSAAMEAGLAETIERGGVLHRYFGGYWGKPGTTADFYAEPTWYVPQTVVNALERRGLLAFTEWRHNSKVLDGPEFPVAAVVTRKATNQPVEP